MLHISDSCSYDIVYTCHLRLSCNEIGKSSYSIHTQISVIFHTKKRIVSLFNRAKSKILIVSVDAKRCRTRMCPHLWEAQHHITDTLKWPRHALATSSDV